MAETKTTDANRGEFSTSRASITEDDTLMLRLRLFALTVLFSLGLLPGASLAQAIAPYGTAVPTRPFVTNGPNAVSGWGTQPMPPRGPKTITFPPQNAAPLPANPGGMRTAFGGRPILNGNAASTTGAVRANGFSSTGETTARSELSLEPTSRLTDPMLQNMSNPSNLSSLGMDPVQQTAPNLYFGQRYAEWNNLHDVSMMPASYGEMSRTIVRPFGIQEAPNTYFGTGFSNWNNMSSGIATPNPLGSWSYSIR